MKGFGTYTKDFRLPFPAVALNPIIGVNSIVLIADTIKNQVGFEDERIILSFKESLIEIDDRLSAVAANLGKVVETEPIELFPAA